jgi:phosphate starvation-inducible protein PhoH and related proteins
LQQERTIVLDSSLSAVDIYGEHDKLLLALEKRYAASVVARGSEVLLRGTEKDVEQLAKVIEEMQKLARNGKDLSVTDVEQIMRMVSEDTPVAASEVLLHSVKVSSRKAPVRAKNAMQQAYMQAIMRHDVVFSIGPAGTGKTYVALAMAVAALEEDSIKRIILTRPVVEAGENLGFLPGDLQEKLSPYMRPLYDALHDMMDYEKMQRLLSYGVIEIAPLAYMRGRTLNNCFVILDEAQNTTTGQMKMFLTRLGYGSKAVVTGDVTQIDLQADQESGLIHADGILQGVKGIERIEFSSADVVRHRLVRRIIEAYERDHRNSSTNGPKMNREESV